MSTCVQLSAMVELVPDTSGSWRLLGLSLVASAMGRERSAFAHRCEGASSNHPWLHNLGR